MIVLGNFCEFEVRIKYKGSCLSYEEMNPDHVAFPSYNMTDMLKEYIKHIKTIGGFNEENVWEYRVNYIWSPQGHYFNPNYGQI